MDVLLVNPRNIESRNFGVTPPFGLASIGGELEKNGFSARVLDLDIFPEDFDLSAYIKKTSPKIVGISGTTHSRFESFSIANIAKQVSKEIVTVYGGCHATFTIEDTLSSIRDIDYIVFGEGEATFLELVNFLIRGRGAVENMAGIGFRGNGSVVRNPPRARISDLDSLAHSRHLLDMEKYDIKLDTDLDLPATTILTSRGCPYSCSFCSASAMFGKTYTMKSAKKVLEEIHYCIERYGIKGIRFFDSTLTLNRAHILSLTKELKTITPRLPWFCEIRVDTVDRELLRAMREAGCYGVDCGVESVSEHVLERIGKKISPEQVINAMKWCKELGIRTVAYFSFGHIGETWLDTKKTLDFIDNNYKLIWQCSEIFGIKIYPGTFLEAYAKKHGLLPKDFSWSGPFKNWQEGPIETDNVPILLQPNYGIKELKQCYYAVEGIRSKKLLHLDNILGKWQRLNSPYDLLHKTLTMLRLSKKALLTKINLG